MLKIGEFSKLSRISVRMLRHYEGLGLLCPAEVDAYTGYRYYHEEQLVQAGRIAALRAMGFSLAAVGEMLRCFQDAQALNGFLRVRQAELSAQAEEAARQLRMLQAMQNRLREDGTMMKYDVNIKTFPERQAATLRQIIPQYSGEGELWGMLMQETAAMNLIPDDPCLCCAVYHDKEFKETDVDVEIQKTVRGSYADTEHVHFRTLPAVTVASAAFRGSYDQMDEVNSAVVAWVLDNGYTFNGPAFFIYHISPFETENPDEYITEVCYPVAK